MTNSSTTWPPEEQAREIHARLVADDPVASAELANAFLDPLAAWVERNNPRIDPHICVTAAEDAILSLIKNPKSYDPSRQALAVYLRLSAKGDLKNALRSESRYRQRRTDLSAVELSATDRKSLQERTDPALVAERRAAEEEMEEVLAPRPVPESVRANLSRDEAEVLELMRDGERKTAAFANALKITHLAPQVQRQEVKRIKDRINRRLKRTGANDD